MPSKGMKKLRKVEKIGLVVLCVVMLVGLGVGSGQMFAGMDGDNVRGTFVIDGETHEVPGIELGEYWTYMTFLRIFQQVPAWKFSRGGRYDPDFADFQPSEEDLWTFIVLEKLAEKAGTVVPTKSVQDWIRDVFKDRESGRYQREIYMSFLRSEHVSRVWATASEFEKFLMRYLRVQYFVQAYTPLLMPTQESVYQQWSVRNRRHDVDYAVQSLSSLRREIDPAALPKEEVEAHYAQDKVRRNFRVPTRREFEAIHVVLADVTDEQFAKIKTKAETDGLVKLDPQEGFQHYYANEPRLYPISKVVERLKAEWEAEQEKKKEAEKPEDEGEKPADETKPDDEAKPADADAEKPADADSEKPADADEKPADADEKPTDAPAEEPKVELPAAVLFVDPTAEMTPTEKYETYFKEAVERELLLKKVLEKLLKNERIPALRIGFEKISGDWGLPLYATETPLDQYEVLSNEPVGGQRLREGLNKVMDGTPYAETVVEIGREEKRGYAIWKVISVEKEHYPELGSEVEEKLLKNTLPIMARIDYAELEDASLREALAISFPDVKLPEKETFTVDEIVRLLLRQSKAEEEARAKLQKVMEAVTAAGQTFRAAAEEKGYRVFSLDGVGNETPMAKPEEPGEDEELTAEEEKQRSLDGHRWFLLKGRSFASGLPQNMSLIGRERAESFVPEVLVDRESDAAFLVWVKAHRVPGPEEMPAVEAGRIRTELMQQNRRATLRAQFEWEDIVERYSVEVKGLTDKPAEEEPKN